VINIGSKIRDPTWHVGKIEPEKVPTQKVFIEATKSQIGDVTNALELNIKSQKYCAST